MGYVHDVNMSVFVNPNQCRADLGTWAYLFPATGWVYAHTPAVEAYNLIIPCLLWGNSAAYRGCKLVSVDIWWENLAAAMTVITGVLNKEVMPANGAAFAAPTSLAFSYDSGHDLAAERVTIDQHKMTLTLTTPLWLTPGDKVHAQLYCEAAALSEFNFYGAQFNFTLRV
jgi:hypothetical protein